MIRVQDIERDVKPSHPVVLSGLRWIEAVRAWWILGQPDFPTVTFCPNAITEQTKSRNVAMNFMVRLRGEGLKGLMFFRLPPAGEHASRQHSGGP